MAECGHRARCRSYPSGPLDDAKFRIPNQWLPTVTAVIVVHIFTERRSDEISESDGTVMTNETPVRNERDSTSGTVPNTRYSKDNV